MRLRVGFAGMAHFHGFQMLDELMASPLADVAAIADIDPVFADTVTGKYSIPVRKLDEVVRDPEIDVVVTAAVNKQKPGIIIRSLEHGKSVIADKPMATTPEGLTAIRRTLENHPDALLLMALTERFSPALVTAGELIERGEIGRVVHMISVKPHRLNAPSRPSWFFDHDLYGGLINDLTVHDIDIFRWFTHSNVKRILASEASNFNYTQRNGFEDHAEVLLEMEDGSAGYIFVNWLTPDAYPFHGDYRILVTGTRGQLEVCAADPAAPKVILCNDRRGPEEAPIRSREANITEHFLACILDRSVCPAVGGEDALIATGIALEAQRKAERRDPLCSASRPCTEAKK